LQVCTHINRNIVKKTATFVIRFIANSGMSVRDAGNGVTATAGVGGHGRRLPVCERSWCGAIVNILPSRPPGIIPVRAISVLVTCGDAKVRRCPARGRNLVFRLPQPIATTHAGRKTGAAESADATGSPLH
jgi:hypothetical protein